MRIISSFVRGREARPAPAAWNVAKMFAQALTIWAVFLWLLPALLYYMEGATGLARFRFAGPVSYWTGVVVFTVFGTFGLTCGVLISVRGQGTPLPLDSTRALVVFGPYRYVRNPMAIASFTQGVGVALILGSPFVLVYALAGYVVWNGVLRPWEEADLERRFGQQYKDYCRAVRCWVPHLTPYTPPVQ